MPDDRATRQAAGRILTILSQYVGKADGTLTLGELHQAAIGLSHDRDDPVVKALASFVRTFQVYRENSVPGMENNGEAWLIRTLARFKPATILDVGANVGTWAAIARAECPEAAIHCFEIVPETFAKLKAATEHWGDRVVVNPFGLGRSSGTVMVNVHDGESEVSGVTDMRWNGLGERRQVACAIMGGDEYLAANGIATIDLMKIDVEGGEPAVLAGFERALAEGRITVLQIEYGYPAIHTKFLLRDLYGVMASQGFHLGKLHHDRVEFSRYEYAMENFITANFVACRADRPDLLDALSIRGFAQTELGGMLAG